MMFTNDVMDWFIRALGSMQVKCLDPGAQATTQMVLRAHKSLSELRELGGHEGEHHLSPEEVEWLKWYCEKAQARCLDNDSMHIIQLVQKAYKQLEEAEYHQTNRPLNSADIARKLAVLK